MASVVACVLGGSPRRLEGMSTIADVKAAMSLSSPHAASVNGEPAADDFELNDEDFVSLAPAVKGGAR